MRILCLDGVSGYGATNAFTTSVAAGFTQAGHEVTRVHVHRAVRATSAPPVDLVFSFGGVGSGLPWDIPFLTWLVDNPVVCETLPALQSGRDGVLVVAREHEPVVTEFLGLDLAVGFVPHGIDTTPDLAPPGFDAADRPVDVMLAASYDPPARPVWVTGHPVLERVVSSLLADADARWDAHVRELEVAGLFRAAADAVGVPVSVDLHRRAAPLLAWLDAELRVRRRVACVRALDAAGIAVQLVGNGWQHLDGLEHAVLVGPVDHGEVLQMARAAKVVLNVGPPLFNQGWHERVPLACSAGAACVTETTDFIAGDPKLPALVDQFAMREIDGLVDVVRAAVVSRDRADRAREAYELVCSHHSWAHRADAILQMVEL